MEKPDKIFDVLIIGGGISGSLTALSLLRENKRLKIAIIEQSSDFPQKVGESTSDITVLIFQQLGIKHLLDKHLDKAGLRFLFNESNVRLEFASPALKGTHIGYHLDRKQLDTDLLEEASLQGAMVYRPAIILDFYGDNFKNNLRIDVGDTVLNLQSRWLADASGRSRFIARNMNWKDLQVDLETASVMGHFSGVSPNDQWDFPENKYWKKKAARNRDHSTVHFMRKHSWWWLIRLNDEITSIGVVYDRSKIKTHSPEQYFEETLKNDSELGVITRKAKKINGRTIEQLPYITSHLYDKGRVLVGDSGAFTDPFLSPGLEMICQQTQTLARLISSEISTLKFNKAEWRRYNNSFIESYKSRMIVYRYGYQIMETYDIFVNWLRLGNFGYFGLFVFPAVLFKKRLEKPFRLNQLDKITLKFYYGRLKRIYEKKNSRRLFNNRPFSVCYSGVEVPRNYRFYYIPLKLWFRWISGYLRLEFKLATQFFRSKL